MASCDDPGTTNVDEPSHIRETVNVRDQGFAVSGEGQISRPSPVLGNSFPSFTCDEPFVNGTPSGEVLLRLPRRHEHVGEPAQTSVPVQNIKPGEQNKGIEELKKQFSSIQTALAAITAKLRNAEVGPRRDSTEQREHARDQSASAPIPFPSRTTNICSDRGQSMDRYNRGKVSFAT